MNSLSSKAFTFILLTFSFQAFCGNYACQVNLGSEDQTERLYFDYIDDETYELTIVAEGRKESTFCGLSYDSPYANDSYVSNYFSGAIYLECEDPEFDDSQTFALFGGQDEQRHALLLDKDHYLSMDSCEIN